jgi:hypothetical protein
MIVLYSHGSATALLLTAVPRHLASPTCPGWATAVHPRTRPPDRHCPGLGACSSWRGIVAYMIECGCHAAPHGVGGPRGRLSPWSKRLISVSLCCTHPRASAACESSARSSKARSLAPSCCDRLGASRGGEGRRDDQLKRMRVPPIPQSQAAWSKRRACPHCIITCTAQWCR